MRVLVEMLSEGRPRIFRMHDRVVEGREYSYVRQNHTFFSIFRHGANVFGIWRRIRWL